MCKCKWVVFILRQAPGFVKTPPGKITSFYQQSLALSPPLERSPERAFRELNPVELSHETKLQQKKGEPRRVPPHEVVIRDKQLLSAESVSPSLSLSIPSLQVSSAAGPSGASVMDIVCDVVGIHGSNPFLCFTSQSQPKMLQLPRYVCSVSIVNSESRLNVSPTYAGPILTTNAVAGVNVLCARSARLYKLFTQPSLLPSACLGNHCQDASFRRVSSDMEMLLMETSALETVMESDQLTPQDTDADPPSLSAPTVPLILVLMDVVSDVVDDSFVSGDSSIRNAFDWPRLVPLTE